MPPPEKKDWRGQLRELKGPIVTELRNEKEITRAIKYAEEEVKSHLKLTADTEGKILILKALLAIIGNIGLGQTNKELSKSMGELIELVDMLDQASSDLIAGAEAQVVEYGEELERVRSIGNALLPAVSFSEIAKELKNRQEERDEATHIQEALENQRDEKREEVNVLKQLLSRGVSRNPSVDRSKKISLEQKLVSLEKNINTILESVAQNDREVERLVAYQNAVKLVAAGLPEGLIGKRIQLGK